MLTVTCIALALLSLWGTTGLAVGMLIAIESPPSWPVAAAVLFAAAALGYGVDREMFGPPERKPVQPEQRTEQRARMSETQLRSAVGCDAASQKSDRSLSRRLFTAEEEDHCAEAR